MMNKLVLVLVAMNLFEIALLTVVILRSLSVQDELRMIKGQLDWTRKYSKDAAYVTGMIALWIGIPERHVREAQRENGVPWEFEQDLAEHNADKEGCSCKL